MHILILGVSFVNNNFNLRFAWRKAEVQVISKLLAD